MALTAAERKRIQRLRDKQPGSRYEMTYRATAAEYKKIEKLLDGLRSASASDITKLA